MLDGPTVELEKLLELPEMNKGYQFAKDEALRTVDAAAKAHGVANRIADADVASLVLADAISIVTRELYTSTSGYSSLRWLWLLRRVPSHLFAGDYSTSYGYHHTLAHVVAGAATGQSRMSLLDGGAIRAYPIDETVARRLARFCGYVRVLSSLHRDYRWAGKGLRFEFHRGRIPHRMTDDGLRESVHLYDERVEETGGVGRMGTEVFQPTGSRVDLREVLRSLTGDRPTALLRVLPTPRPLEFPVPAVDADLTAEDVPSVHVLARYIPLPVPLQSLSELVDATPPGERIFDAEAASLLFLMFASIVHVVNHRAGFAAMCTMGYLVSSEEKFRRNLASAFEITPEPIAGILNAAGVTSTDLAIGHLERMTGATWPLEPGPLFYRDQDAFAVDLVAVGRRLHDAVVYPKRQGEIANIRGNHFELRVQHAIDGSSHAPPPEIRAYRGRTLKPVGGRAFTDLDAVARVNDTTLALISCKSIVYTPEYDKGEERAVQNAASRVRSAREEWSRIVDTLRNTPEGTNYDLRGWDLVGVVCTPSVVWIELGPCTEYVVPGLRGVVSLPELHSWLSTARPR